MASLCSGSALSHLTIVTPCRLGVRADSSRFRRGVNLTHILPDAPLGRGWRYPASERRPRKFRDKPGRFLVGNQGERASRLRPEQT